MLDVLITNNRKTESTRFLEKAIAYNKKVQKKLQQFIDINKSKLQEFYKENFHESMHFKYCNDDHLESEVWQDYTFYQNTGFIVHNTPYYIKNIKSYITTIINVTATSKDSEIQLLINELNQTYDSFIKRD